MKIRDDQPNTDFNQPVAPPAECKATKIAGSRKQAVRSDIDRITLSPRAHEYRAACKRLAETPDIRTEKVAEVKARLTSERYRIEADKIAARMIRDALTADD
jgi:flagellar biosynthesis anti-sigma factor FlgM